MLCVLCERAVPLLFEHYLTAHQAVYVVLADATTIARRAFSADGQSPLAVRVLRPHALQLVLGTLPEPADSSVVGAFAQVCAFDGGEKELHVNFALYEGAAAATRDWTLLASGKLASRPSDAGVVVSVVSTLRRRPVDRPALHCVMNALVVSPQVVDAEIVPVSPSNPLVIQWK
jgi:hypothetical protein